jgi:hypothetical protein
MTSAQRLNHVRARLLPQSRRGVFGGSRPPSAGRGAQAQTTAADADPDRPLLLDPLPRLWPRGSDVLILVKPETVVRRHRAGFRFCWRWRSRYRGGRPRISEELRTPIREGGANLRGGTLLADGSAEGQRLTVAESLTGATSQSPRRGDSSRWAKPRSRANFSDGFRPFLHDVLCERRSVVLNRRRTACASGHTSLLSARRRASRRAGRSRHSVNDLSTDEVHQTLTRSTRGAYKIALVCGETDA